jgi:AcrR family transcriptional regulator
MAGHIKRRTIASNLDKVGETVLLEKIASGMTMAGLARELKISNLSLYHWIRKDPDREERFKQARAIAADQWADECLDIADASDNLSANSDRLKIETRKWLAGIAAPEKFQAKPTAAVQVNVNQLHLDALRQLNLASSNPHSLDGSNPHEQEPEVTIDLTPPKQVGSHNLDADDLPGVFDDD